MPPKYFMLASHAEKVPRSSSRTENDRNVQGLRKYASIPREDSQRFASQCRSRKDSSGWRKQIRPGGTGRIIRLGCARIDVHRSPRDVQFRAALARAIQCDQSGERPCDAGKSEGGKRYRPPVGHEETMG